MEQDSTQPRLVPRARWRERDLEKAVLITLLVLVLALAAWVVLRGRQYFDHRTADLDERIGRMEKAFVDRSQAIAQVQIATQNMQKSLDALRQQIETVAAQDAPRVQALESQVATLQTAARQQASALASQQMSLGRLQADLEGLVGRLRGTIETPRPAATPEPRPSAPGLQILVPGRRAVGERQTTSLRLTRGDEEQVGRLRIRLIRINGGNPNDRADQSAELQIDNGLRINNIIIAQYTSQIVDGYTITADEIHAAPNQPGEGSARLRVEGVM